MVVFELRVGVKRYVRGCSRRRRLGAIKGQLAFRERAARQHWV
jgi:hypothetical protein